MIKAKVTSISTDRASIVCEDGQSLTVPLATVEGNLKVGQDVAIVVAALGSEDAGRHKLAQALLNELLKT